MNRPHKRQDLDLNNSGPNMQTKPCKVVFILVDGLGDVNLPSLFANTPLQVARTPYMDLIAAAGCNGCMDPVEPGLPCGSDTAHLSILGYNPKKVYRGRGAFECMGAGVDMDQGDIAFKCNFAYMDDQTGIVLQRRADREFQQEGPELCDALNGIKLRGYENHSIRVKYATEHRCAVVLSGPGLCDDVSDTDPLRDNLRLLLSKPTKNSQQAQFTANLINSVSNQIREILCAHRVNKQRQEAGKVPANVVLFRGCSQRQQLDSMMCQFGMHGGIIAPTKIIAGLGKTVGLDEIQMPSSCTGGYHTDFMAKATGCVDCVINKGYDFVFVHTKAVDDCGHDGLPALKVLYIESVDTMIGQILHNLLQRVPLLAKQPTHTTTSQPNAEPDATARVPISNEAPSDVCVVVTADHSTPVEFGDHSHEPVPFTIARLSDIATVLQKSDQPVTPPRMGNITCPVAAQSVQEAAQQVSEVQRRVKMSDKSELEHLRKEWVEQVKGQWGVDRLVTAGNCGADVYDGGDDVQVFNEIECCRGVLGRFVGCEVMNIVQLYRGAV